MKTFIKYIGTILMTALLFCAVQTNSDAVRITAEAEEIQDLAGCWKTEEKDGTRMEAWIGNGTVSVYWSFNDGAEKTVYWIGTYEEPSKTENGYSWSSERDAENTDEEIFASGDDEKKFTYDGEKIDTVVSAFGVTNVQSFHKSESTEAFPSGSYVSTTNLDEIQDMADAVEAYMTPSWKQDSEGGVIEALEETETEAMEYLDFNEETNAAYSIGGLTFEVPSSWKTSERNNDDLMYFYCTDGMLSVQRMENEGDLLEEENTAAYINGIESGDFENITNAVHYEQILKGCSKTVLFYGCSCTIAESDVNFYSVSGSFENNSCIIAFAFIENKDAEVSRLNDYFAILDTVSYAERDDADDEYGKLLEEYNKLKDEYDALTEKTESGAETDSKTESAEEQDTDVMTMGQKNALSSAESYLNFSAFSYSGLIKQLEYEGYSTEDATFAADNCGADWNEQAVNSAESYLSFSSFSRDELIKQLEFEGFTTEEAEYAAEAVGY